MFGVMFGDIGHGGLLLLSAILIFVFADKLPAGVVKMRYLLLLMGFYAFYMGLLYNDFMSIPLSLFGPSCYTISEEGQYELKDADCQYPFGMDPAWMNSEADIVFYNSFKMKCSVILGVVQMTAGICIKGLNAVYFKNHLDLYHEFLPQFFLLLALFGFMDYLILCKWFTDYNSINEISRAPSIVGVMINMFLNFGEI